MKNFYSLALASVAMMTSFTACNNDAEEISIRENEIRLTSEITPSRVTSLDYQSTQIAEGQQIGVTITGAQEKHQNVAWNVGKNGALTNTGNPVFWGDGQATITAYHPFHQTWTGTSHQFSVSTDQSTDTGYSNSDLLWTSTTASIAVVPVNLKFAHLLSKINVTLSSDEMEDLSNTTICICGSKITTTFNPTSGDVSEASDIQEIKASVTTEEAYTASAILVPQTIKRGTKFIKITRGSKDFYYTLPKDMEFESGYSYHFKLKVDNSNLENPIEGEETEW